MYELMQSGLLSGLGRHSGAVNERAPEEQRATILSFQTGLFSDRTLQRGDDSSVSTLWSGGLACGVYDRLRVVFRSAERR